MSAYYVTLGDDCKYWTMYRYAEPSPYIVKRFARKADAERLAERLNAIRATREGA